MVETATEPLHIYPSQVGILELEGSDLPYVDLEDEPFVGSVLELEGTEYAYQRSFPVKGHSAVMPAAVAELHAAGKRLLVAERGERYCLYAA